jgi:hypothetical protein
MLDIVAPSGKMSTRSVEAHLVRLLVEGLLDEAVGIRLTAHCGHSVLQTHGKQGFGYIRSKLAAFNSMAATAPVLVLTDSMDMHEPCPPATLSALLPAPHPSMRFRLAVREIESWLMADSENLSRFLGVAKKHFPTNPEGVTDPKQTLISLARRSRARTTRALMVPPPGASVSEGKGYTSEMMSFVRNHWNIAAAARRAESLEPRRVLRRAPDVSYATSLCAA